MKKHLGSLAITLLMLILLEVFSTTLLPMLGLSHYIIPFNIMIVLFLGLKLDTPYLSLIIFVLQYCHSFFSIESWELGTIAGIVICLIISQLRELIHLTSVGATILMTFIFGQAWFLTVSILFYLKFEDFDFIINKFSRFLPEVIVISFCAPFFFSILDKIWKAHDSEYLGDSP